MFINKLEWGKSSDKARPVTILKTGKLKNWNIFYHRKNEIGKKRVKEKKRIQKKIWFFEHALLKYNQKSNLHVNFDAQ